MVITEQLLSRTSYTTDGTTTSWSFSFSGGYLLSSHVKAYTTDSSDVQTPVTGTLTGPFTLSITPAIPAGKTLTIYRDTPKAAPMVDFANETGFSEIALDTNAKQAVFAAAEAADASVYGKSYAQQQAALAAAAAAAASSSASTAASYANGASNALSSASAAATAAIVAKTAAEAAAASINPNAYTPSTGTTGAALIPAGTTAQRPSATIGAARFNTTTRVWEGYNGFFWERIGGATGADLGRTFHENDMSVNSSYTLSAGKNAGSFGPITINTVSTVTVPDDATWSIV